MPAPADRRRPVHPFPARMAPDIALGLVRGRRCRMTVLDPMAGSGTVLVSARDTGHTAIGFDMDPLAVLISRVWASPIDRTLVRRRAASVLDAARRDCKADGAAEAYPRGADEETRQFVRYWFDPTARRQLASLSASISRVRDQGVRDALWCAFSRLIIAKQAGASRAMDLSHSRPHRAFSRAPALPLPGFDAAVGRVLEGCATGSGDPVARKPADGRRAGGTQVDVRMGDARRLDLGDGSVDMVITSPPYLNAIDYMRSSKFSLVWMGHTIGTLRGIRSESIGTEVGMRDDGLLEEVASGLGCLRSLHGRGRAILTRYVCDMRLVVEETARVLAAGGTAAYVIGENTVRGTYISNSRIVERLAAGAGLDVVAKRSRRLPARSRYLPPPLAPPRAGALDGRIRREVVLEMRKR